MDDNELTGYKDACIFDLCQMEGDIANGLCVVAEALATACADEFKIHLNWRGENFCGMYHSNVISN